MRSGTNAFTCAAASCQPQMLCYSNHCEVDTIRFNWSDAITQRLDDWNVSDRRNVSNTHARALWSTLWLSPIHHGPSSRSDAIVCKVIVAFPTWHLEAWFRHKNNVLDTMLRRNSTPWTTPRPPSTTWMTISHAVLSTRQWFICHRWRRIRDAVEFGRANRRARSTVL